MPKTLSAFAVVLLSVCNHLPANAESPQDKSATTHDNLGTATTDGIPLDGSIIIDESIWVSLLGEPGAHMADSFSSFQAGKTAESAGSARKAAAFLFIASNNAFHGPSAKVQAAAEALQELARNIEAGNVEDEHQLKEVFGRAHLALSGHHFSKAASAIKQKNWAFSSNYLRSAASHFQRASRWSGQPLRADTAEQIADAKETPQQPSNAEATNKMSELIQSLRTRLEAFRARITETPDTKE